jgi:hypothetical protein
MHLLSPEFWFGVWVVHKKVRRHSWTWLAYMLIETMTAMHEQKTIPNIDVEPAYYILYLLTIKKEASRFRSLFKNVSISIQ